MRYGHGLKRLGAVMLTALMLLLVCASAYADSYPYSAIVTANANLRRSASSSSVVLLRVSAGDTVIVQGRSGSYDKVSYNGVTGYIIRDYLLAYEAQAAKAEENATVSGYPYETTVREKVNLREKASTSSNRLTTMPEGARVTVLGESGSFAQVSYNGLTGYAVKSYINLKEIVAPTPAPAQVMPAQNPTGYEVLQIGSTGAAVKALEEAMKELGFFAGTPDTVFDSATKTAVIALQEKNKYPATGVVDTNFQAFLYSGQPKNAKGSATRVNTLAPIDGVTIRKNNTGDLVGQVQAKLAELGYYDGPVTGEYDTASMNAVKAFQKKAGLTADGICGAETQKALFSSSADPIPTVLPVQTPSPTFQAPGSKVKRGVSGSDARLVQERLRQLGYYTGEVDGKFGSASESALKAFQRKNNLKDDGVAGSETNAVLFSVSAVPAVETPAPTQAPTREPVATATPAYPTITKKNVVVIRNGVSGTAVINLQRRLTELGYYTASMDGVCRAADTAAIRLFQQKNGLSADGVAGYDTQIVLYSDAAVTNTTTSGATNIFYSTLRMGNSGEAVKRLQNRLIQLGYLTGAADGKYGHQTAEAVTAFQRANGLIRDGVAGQQTQALLYAAAVATPVPTPTVTPAPQENLIPNTVILRKGDRSMAVTQLQQRLISFGYLSGTADGVFGMQTYNALRAFQRANGLKVDGVAGQSTIGALNGLLAQATPLPVATEEPAADVPVGSAPNPAQVIYANWYNEVRAVARVYQYATVYDYHTGVSWQVHMFSFGHHAEAEPLTAADTAAMEADFGGNVWEPAKPVWVIFGNGQVYMATTHSMPHGVQHITDNSFPGHMCIHFPRTASQVAAIGPYATRHQRAVDVGWQETQDMIQTVK